jgi:hypothetical protein
MKAIVFVLSLCFSACLNSFGHAYEKIKDGDVGSGKIEIAKKFAYGYLNSQKNGSYYQFKDEAIDVVKQKLTETLQKAGYKQLKDSFGDFLSLSYAETWISKNNPGFKIMRFKGDFDKSTQKLEIRVILNESDKIAGLWIRPWADGLN